VFLFLRYSSTLIYSVPIELEPIRANKLQLKPPPQVSSLIALVHVPLCMPHFTATALASGSGTPSSATKAANRRAAAKNAKAAAAGTASPAAASNAAVGSTVPTSAGISTSASTSMPTVAAATNLSTAASQPSQTQAAAPGPATAAPKAKSRSKVQIDYSSEPSATYLAQLQASSSSGALPATTAGSTPKTKATAGEILPRASFVFDLHHPQAFLLQVKWPLQICQQLATLFSPPPTHQAAPLSLPFSLVLPAPI
jgi:hypothetical protein